MFDRYLSDIAGHTVNQTIGIGIWTPIFCNLICNESIHHLKTREIKILGLVQHERRNHIVEPAAEISKPRVLLLNIVTVNYVVSFTFQLIQHSNDFLRRILAIIVQDRDIETAGLFESGKYRAVLAEIATQMHESDVLRELLGQAGTNLFAVIFRTVVNQNDFKRCRSKDLSNVLDQWTDGATAVVNGNY